jgi:hypothetical protein
MPNFKLEFESLTDANAGELKKTGLIYERIVEADSEIVAKLIGQSMMFEDMGTHEYLGPLISCKEVALDPHVPAWTEHHYKTIWQRTLENITRKHPDRWVLITNAQGKITGIQKRYFGA